MKKVCFRDIPSSLLKFKAKKQAWMQLNFQSQLIAWFCLPVLPGGMGFHIRQTMTVKSFEAL